MSKLFSALCLHGPFSHDLYQFKCSVTTISDLVIEVWFEHCILSTY